MLVTAQGTTGDTIDTAANVAVTLSAGTADAVSISAIRSATSGLINGALLTAINGTASAVVQAIADLDTDPTNFNSTLTGAALAADITAIEAVNGTGTIDGAAITSVSGTTTAVIQALTDLDVGASTVAVTITDQPSLANLKAINAATSGVITLQITTGALSGSAADLAAAFSGITSYTGNLTVTDQPTLAELITINNATSGSITLNVVTSSLSGTAVNLTEAFATTITSYDGALTVTGDLSGAAGVTAINTIAAASNAAITTTGTLSGLSTELALLTTTATDVVTISITNTASSSVAASVLSGIGAKSAGTVTVANALAISGTVAELKAALVTVASAVTATTSSVTVSDAVNTSVLASEITAIAGVVASITITNGITLTGSEAEISTALTLENITLPTDIDVTVTGAFSIGTSLLAVFDAVAQSTTGDLSIVGSSFNDTLNASTYTGDGSQGLSISGGSGADNITGTSFNDVLSGGLGADTVRGGDGSDSITLGTGVDTLILNSLSGSDTIADFNVTDDLIQLTKSVMTALGTVGALTDAEFESGAGLTAAVDATTRIIYDTTSGALFYDVDGSGVGAAVQLATFTGVPSLTLADLFIV
jgi:Ca2+-binding RTX toxin-like protein